MREFKKCLLVLSALVMFWIPTIANAQNHVLFSQNFNFSATQAATNTVALPEASLATVHTLYWTVTGTVVGTVTLQGSTTLTGSYTTLGASTAQSLAASGSYTFEGTTTAFLNLSVNIGTCTTCTIQINYFGVDYSPVGNLQDNAFFVPPTDCFEVASANAAGNDGKFVVSGSMLSLTGQVSSTGNTQFTCQFPFPYRTTTGKGITSITDITWLVGTVTTQPTSITAVTFKTQSPPAAAATEVLASATLVDATGGGTTLLPTSTQFAGFTVGAAGQAWSIKETFTTNPAVNTDLQLFTATITFNQSAAAAMVTPLFGIVVHYNTTPL